MTDPLYQQILDGLAGELDPKVFEDCACDLLRDIYPSLVPVRGGNDAGMDGAISDMEGEAFPLICTTRQDFRRNLAESLDSYVARGRHRRKAVFVTSREVNSEQRNHLEETARGKDFTLVQIVDRQWDSAAPLREYSMASGSAPNLRSTFRPFSGSAIQAPASRLGTRRPRGGSGLAPVNTGGSRACRRARLRQDLPFRVPDPVGLERSFSCRSGPGRNQEGASRAASSRRDRRRRACTPGGSGHAHPPAKGDGS